MARGGSEDGSVTAHLRLLETRRNEDLVLAESSLAGERRVSWVRLATVALFALTQGVLAPAFGHADPPDRLRQVTVVIYVLFAIALLVQLRRLREPNPRLARYAPLATAVIDYAFMTFMGARDLAAFGRVYPEMGVAAFGIVLSFSVARYHWLHVLWSTVLACASYVLLGVLGHALSPISTPFVCGGFAALGLLVGLTNGSIRRLFRDLRRRDNLSRLLPAAIVDRVISYGAGALLPVQREVTVLFSDIRGFTAIAETLAPRDVLALLDEYFGHMAQVVKGRDGMVNKFLGDGLLAVWGVPDRTTDHAERAVRAALDMRTALAELNCARVARGEPAIEIGIGLHTGTVAAGMLGGADQGEYTVIGDAVNVASRIEGLTKALHVEVLASESTWRLVSGRFRGERVAEEKVKGRAEPVVVYAVRSEPDP
ncbi:MAG TPA: adenylate/guanylate cyclase domain-containing protein [Myxococcota bacterium]|jgi:adenylate cyclase|nr:adenylate/guanylate cyclase domain-containing protein [Myxococcota bacterium]